MTARPARPPARGVLPGLAVLALAVLLAGCGPGEREAPPWEVEHLADGGIRVLGLRPGQDTLARVLERHGRRVEAALFESPDGELAVEAHYGSVAAAGITGRLIVTLDLGEEVLAALKRASPNYIFLETGSRRHELDALLADALLDERIRVVSFAPSANLDEETLTARFGPPAERVETGTGETHLLYPARGTDVLVDPEGGVIVQYVHPRDFAWLRREQGI